jgi:hypothetical protein
LVFGLVGQIILIGLHRIECVMLRKFTRSRWETLEFPGWDKLRISPEPGHRSAPFRPGSQKSATVRPSARTLFARNSPSSLTCARLWLLENESVFEAAIQETASKSHLGHPAFAGHPDLGCCETQQNFFAISSTIY